MHTNKQADTHRYIQANIHRPTHRDTYTQADTHKHIQIRYTNIHTQTHTLFSSTTIFEASR